MTTSKGSLVNIVLFKKKKVFLSKTWKAQTFDIWCVASARRPLPRLFKLCPLGQTDYLF